MFILVDARSGRSFGLPAYRDRKAARLAAQSFSLVMGQPVSVQRVGGF